MTTLTFIRAAAAALCLIAAAPATAASVFSQPLFNGSDGGGFSNDPRQLIAAGFTLGNDTDIAQITWFGGGFDTEDFGDFRIQFLSDDEGAPDQVLASVTRAADQMTDTGLINGYGDRVFRFTMDIPVFHAAAGVRYYASVADVGDFNFIWALSDRDCCSKFRIGANGDWGVDSVRGSNAFTLSSAAAAVPEPATWAMLITGFAASGAMLRRRRAAFA